MKNKEIMKTKIAASACVTARRALTTAAAPPAASFNLAARATITARRALTPTAVALDLLIHEEDVRQGFDFSAGQWVDLQSPGVKQLGGFSICSTSQELPRLELAIRDSPDWAPARWCYHDAAVGDEVSVRVGGDFTLGARATVESGDLLLIAGGIGINPLISILREIEDGAVPQYGMLGALGRRRRVHLLYSARSVQELAFREEIDGIVQRSLRSNVNVTAELRVTSSDNNAVKNAGEKKRESWAGRRGRFDASDIAAAVALTSEYAVDAGRSDGGSTLEPGNPDVFICGPPLMIKAFAKQAIACGVKEERVHYEQWWE